MTRFPSFLPLAGRWVRRGLLVLMAAFGSAAFYYATIEPDLVRIGLAVAFPLLLGVAAFRKAARIRWLSLTVLILSFWTWYLTDPPRNNRDWAGEYAVPADVRIEGHVAHITHVRNFVYRTEEDYTPRYYDATYDLDRLSSLDLVTSYWAGEAIAHVFLTFGFSDGRHLALSIETRRQKRFPYSAIAGFFHHYEIFYVTADERDLIGVRTDVRKERVYLYRVSLSPEQRKRLLLSYLDEIHMLSTHPMWYNTLTDNCTTGMLARAKVGLSYRLDWRVLLSGYTASLAYDLGLLNRSYSFPELKKRSRIWRADGAQPGPTYSQDIRATLPLE